MISLVAALATLAGYWTAVIPEVGAADEHPPPRAVVLSDRAPEDLILPDAGPGTSRRYVQIRFGDAASRRVALVVTEGPGGVTLHVDADRDRTIGPGDLVPGAGPRWRVAISAIQGDRSSSRVVSIRRGITGLTLALATVGWLEGTLVWEGKSHRARRVDGDADGGYASSRDQIWVDWDDDGRFETAGERIDFAPTVAVAGKRVAVRGDQAGTRLDLEALAGTGTVRLARRDPPFVGLTATLAGRDGAAYLLDLAGGEVVVPAGDYQLSSVTCAVADAEGRRWHFTFCDKSRGADRPWQALGPGATWDLDPIGTLRLETGLDPDERPRPGAFVTVQPRLLTGTGLLIISNAREDAGGRPVEGEATTRLLGKGTHPLDEVTSGFA